jgi:hypothetical protein
MKPICITICLLAALAALPAIATPALTAPPGPPGSKEEAPPEGVMIMSACAELWATTTYKELMTALTTIQGDFGVFAARSDSTLKAALAAYAAAKDAYVVTFTVDRDAGPEATIARDQLDTLIAFAAEQEGLFDEAVDYAIGTQSTLRDVIDLSRAAGSNTDSAQAEKAMKDARIEYLRVREASNTYYDLMVPVLSCGYDQSEHLAAQGEFEDTTSPRDPPAEMFVKVMEGVENQSYRIGFESEPDERHDMSPLRPTVDGSAPVPLPDECQKFCHASQNCLAWNYVLPGPVNPGPVPICEIYRDGNAKFTTAIKRDPSYISGFGPAAVARGYALPAD